MDICNARMPRRCQFSSPHTLQASSCHLITRSKMTSLSSLLGEGGTTVTELSYLLRTYGMDYHLIMPSIMTLQYCVVTYTRIRVEEFISSNALTSIHLSDLEKYYAGTGARLLIMAKSRDLIRETRKSLIVCA